MNESAQQKISQVITDIKTLHQKLQTLSDMLKEKLSKFTTIEIEERGSDYWESQVLSDALIRVRIFIERNLSYIETLGVLSLCRYTFELVIWLKHIQMDQRFALVYARMLIKDQIKFYENLDRHLQHEINLYKSLDMEEKAAHNRILDAAIATSDFEDKTVIGQNIIKDIYAASGHIDDKLALKFAIYSSETEHNGYSLQAHLIKTQAIPQALDYVTKNRESLTKFNGHWATTIEELGLKEWKWKERAQHVNMESEYEFIYSCTSRLLHATPASLTTNQKCLEDEEALMFLRYVKIQFRWIIKYAESCIEQQTLH